MRANAVRLLDFLKSSPQFVIPIYQRTYSWTERECRQLWDDILRCGSSDKITAHFIGSIVYIESEDDTLSVWEPLLVIDGQQRLTTVTLLLAALIEEIGDAEPLQGFSADLLQGYYLLNTLERGERRFKLLLSQTDKDSLTAIVSRTEPPKERSLRVTENHRLFRHWIQQKRDDLPTVCRGLAKLMMVDIKLKRGTDNPQLIFESMNSTGLELTQADRIRNYVLMCLDPDLQTRLYQQYWRPMEVEFGQKTYGSHFDGFMRHYLTVKTGEIPRLSEVYDAFKKHARSPESLTAGVEALVSDLRTYAGHFCAMALGTEIDAELKQAFHDVREMKVDVAYPFLLELYNDYATGTLPREDLLSAVRLVEAYVFRRAICAIPTNSLNKTFATFSSELKKDRYLDSIRAHFLLLPSYRRFPSDEEFQREIQTRDLYNFPRRSYWLRRLENHDRKERVPVDEYTIEHILPQNEDLSDQWKTELGPEWERIHKTWLHTLGNLTLTGYNPELSDRPFTEKRNMRGGFKESPLRINKDLGSLEHWNEEAIKARAATLAAQAVAVWAAPSLCADILNTYRPKPETAAGYTIDDHPYLAKGSDLYGGAVRDIFEAFRKQVLSLDPCVNEEFLKLYVAYKAETNFVDVIPQAKRLLLVLNLAFTDITDPKGICRDVSGMGRWGNGDVEVPLSSLDELPYVMGLVRQSLEKQMGNGDT